MKCLLSLLLLASASVSRVQSNSVVAPKERVSSQAGDLPVSDSRALRSGRRQKRRPCAKSIATCDCGVLKRCLLRVGGVNTVTLGHRYCSAAKNAAAKQACLRAKLGTNSLDPRCEALVAGRAAALKACRPVAAAIGCAQGPVPIACMQHGSASTSPFHAIDAASRTHS